MFMHEKWLHFLFHTVEKGYINYYIIILTWYQTSMKTTLYLDTTFSASDYKRSLIFQGAITFRSNVFTYVLLLGKSYCYLKRFYML